MNEDRLKLSVYFGERQQVDRRLFAEELFEAYARARVATSILLRGIEGFGLKHHLRTDASLTLSEDLPALAVAVDSRERIERVAEQVARLSASGTMTVERVRTTTADGTLADLPEDLHEATRLTVFVGRRQRVGGVPGHVAVCQTFHQGGMAAACALLGVDGTVGGRRQRARFFGGNADVPVMVVGVGSGDQARGVLADLGRQLERPPVTVERVRICKRDGEVLEQPHALPAVDDSGLTLWQKLTVYTSESQLARGRPVHRALTAALREAGARGSTTVRGSWGFHGSQTPHGDRTFQWGRHVPAITVVLDTPEGIARSFAIVDQVTGGHGLVTSEMVPAIRLRSGTHTRGGLRLARHRY